MKIPDGLAFSEFEGYDTWQTVAVSETEGSVKAILANPVMIAAYKEGIPGNGKPFPEGSKIVKIEWIKKKNPVSPYFVEIPDTLKTLAFIEKDSRRFPGTHGWGLCCNQLGRARGGRQSTEGFDQTASGSSRLLTNRIASERTQAPSPKARSMMRASPQMSRVMLKAPAWPLRSARITSKPLIVA